MPLQATADRQDTRVAQLTVSCHRLGNELAARENALAAAVSRVAIADRLLHTPPEGDPGRVRPSHPLNRFLGRFSTVAWTSSRLKTPVKPESVHDKGNVVH